MSVLADVLWNAAAVFFLLDVYLLVERFEQRHIGVHRQRRPRASRSARVGHVPGPADRQRGAP